LSFAPDVKKGKESGKGGRIAVVPEGREEEKESSARGKDTLVWVEASLQVVTRLQKKGKKRPWLDLAKKKKPDGHSKRKRRT